MGLVRNKAKPFKINHNKAIKGVLRVDPYGNGVLGYQTRFNQKGGHRKRKKISRLWTDREVQSPKFKIMKNRPCAKVWKPVKLGKPNLPF